MSGVIVLDDVGLIHMNGRLYDPFLDRFCAACPFVQSPNKIQNCKRYTCVLNNPLSLVDLSGHMFGLIFGIVKAIAKAIVGGANGEISPPSKTPAPESVQLFPR